MLCYMDREVKVADEINVSYQMSLNWEISPNYLSGSNIITKDLKRWKIEGEKLLQSDEM